MKFAAISWCMAITMCMAAMGSVHGDDASHAEKSYKILMLLPISCESDVEVFTALAETLADRGHKIVMLVNQLPKNKNYNIFQLFHGLEEFKDDKMDATRGSVSRLASFSKKFFKVSEIMELYFMRRKFDLVVIPSSLNEIAYPFLYEMPFITISTTGVDYGHSAGIGNVLNPAHVSSLATPLAGPLSVLCRLHSTVKHFLHTWYWKHWSIVPTVQREVTEVFPKLPPLLDIERNQTVNLVNSHFTLDAPLPLLPSQVEVGPLHCRPGQPLPENLESWITGAGSAGVLYINLGKEPNLVPVQILVQVFAKLEQRIVWKYNERLDDLPENVFVERNLPQQDILAHPNVRAFVSYADFLSTQEALYHAVPTLAIPSSEDQTKNAQTVVGLKFGLLLSSWEASVDNVYEALKELLDDPSYAQRAKDVSKELLDRPMSPRDLAVFWAEYAIRHPGSKELRSPAKDLSWVEFLMLDVLFVLHLCFFVVFAVLRRAGRWLCRRTSGEGKRKMD